MSNLPRSERRQLTLVRCDLVDSTATGQQLGLEAWDAVHRAWMAHCLAIGDAAGSDVIRYGGDELVFAFGRTLAREDDPRRAVRFALDLNDSLEHLELQVPVRMRIGIATGEAIVDRAISSVEGDLRVIGPVLNMTARILSIAEPGEVVIGELTWRRVLGDFQCAFAGEHTFKGFNEPARCWRVEGRRVDDTRDPPASPLIEREDQCRRLAALWQSVREGRSAGALLSADPGIGKSRLIRWLVDEMDATRTSLVRLRCHARSRRGAGPAPTALEPVIEWLRELCPGPGRESRGGQLAALCRSADLGEAAVEWLLPLLGDEGADVSRHAAPELLRERRIDTLRRLLLGRARAQPLLLVVEDVHWADASTLEWLASLAETAGSAPLLMVLSCRHEPWEGDGPAGVRSFRERVDDTFVELRLDPLSFSGSRNLARRLAGSELDESELERIANLSDGVPLFVEDMVQDALDPWTSKAPATPVPGNVPAPLWASLMSRLDRLGGAKRVAQTAAVIGREFDPLLVGSIGGLDETELRAALAVLVDSRIVESTDDSRDRMQFCHHLVRDVAYDSLLDTDRADLHRAAADHLSGARGRRADAPEAVAWHHEMCAVSTRDPTLRADALRAAAGQWTRAARDSADRSELGEALERLAHVDRLVSDAHRGEPDAGSWAALALEARIEKTYILSLLKGWAHEDVDVEVEACLELAKRLDNPDGTLDLLMLAGGSALTRGNLARAEVLARDCAELGRRDGADGQRARILSARSLAGVQFLRGHHEQALAEIDALASAGPDEEAGRARRNLTEPWVSLRVYQMLSLMCVGRLAAAELAGQHALERARVIGHGHSTAHALCFLAMLSLHVDPRTALSVARESLRFSEENGFATYVEPARIMVRGARAALGQDAGESPEFEEGPVMQGSTYRPFGHAVLATVELRLGAAQRAEQWIDAGLTLAENHGERWYVPELLRLKALTAIGDEPAQALAHAGPMLQRAMDEASDQQAWLFAFRAALSLAELHHADGDFSRVHSVLAPWIERFRDEPGFADLARARALLR